MKAWGIHVNDKNQLEQPVFDVLIGYATVARGRKFKVWENSCTAIYSSMTLPSICKLYFESTDCAEYKIR